MLSVGTSLMCACTCMWSPFLFFFFFFFGFLGGWTQSPSGDLTSSSAHLQEKVPARLTHTSLSGSQGPGVFVHSSISVCGCDVCVRGCVFYTEHLWNSTSLQRDSLIIKSHTHTTHIHPPSHTPTHPCICSLPSYSQSYTHHSPRAPLQSSSADKRYGTLQNACENAQS